MGWLEGIRTRVRLALDRRGAEVRMTEEFRFHIEMETERLVRESGLDRDEARRRALVAFGGVEVHKETLRTGRGVVWLSGMSLDLKLGLRMLARYPGLTFIGVLGMAVAVAIGAVSFGVIYTVQDPSLPLDEGDRVVAIRNVDTRGADAVGPRTHLHDLATWRASLTAVEELGAYRTADRNLIPDEGRPRVARVAEMTASGFRVARVPPLLGRYLVQEDEQRGAPPVVVIGHSLWQVMFEGDSGAVGRTIRLGSTRHTLVGVMPEGFGFPINNRVWAPLRLDPLDFEPGNAPPIEVFARLAPGATLEEAQTQLTTIGQRLAVDNPRTHEHIRPRVVRYAGSIMGTDNRAVAVMLHSVQTLVTLLLLVIATNVAMLVYARTASRSAEMLVRSALGASRGRIVMQLFVEALLLSGAAAGVGLVLAGIALERLQGISERFGGEQIPYWMRLDLSPGVVAYVAGLAVVAAVIVGLLPALKATPRRAHVGLQQLGMGGTGMRLGRTWTVLIVAQVAVAVGILPVAVDTLGFLFSEETPERGSVEGERFPADEFLTTSVRLDREGAGTDDFAAYDAASFRTRFAQRQVELVERLRAEPGVADVAVMSALPGSDGSFTIEVEGVTVAGASDSGATPGQFRPRPALEQVGPGYFDAFGIPLLAGRQFEAGDVASSLRGLREGEDGGGAERQSVGSAVIVNRSFVREYLADANALGRRVRRIAGENGRVEPWYEIVGVVADIPAPFRRRELPRMYRPLVPGAAHPVRIAFRVRGAEPAVVAGRVRDLAVAVDPMLRLSEVKTIEAELHDNDALVRLAFVALLGLTMSVVLLSAAGIYALMSFTVTQRRREIGIRSALGAGARHVVGGVLSRAAGQIAIGIVVGLGLGVVTFKLLGQDTISGRDALMLVANVALMVVVGLLAAVGPALKALRIQPTEALKGDG